MNDLMYTNMLESNRKHIPNCSLCGPQDASETNSSTATCASSYVPPAAQKGPAAPKSEGFFASIVKFFKGD